LTYLSTKDPVALAKRLDAVGVNIDDVDLNVSKRGFGAQIELLIYEYFQKIANFMSPLAILNPDGWGYWLLQFSNTHRGSEEYFKILHQNPSVLGSLLYSGIRMLVADPRNIDQTYLFDATSRQSSVEKLEEDAPRMVRNAGGIMTVEAFRAHAYNHSPALRDDLFSPFFSSVGVRVVTERGGRRRQQTHLQPTDRIILDAQGSFFFMSEVKPKKVES